MYVLKDLTILVMSFCIMNGLHFYHQLDWFKCNVDMMVYGVALFVLIWVLIAQV